VPPETFSENVQLLQGFVGNLADSQIRFDDGTKNEIVKTSQTDFVHRAVDRGALSWKLCDFSSSEVPHAHFNDMRNQRVRTQSERGSPVKKVSRKVILVFSSLVMRFWQKVIGEEVVTRGSLMVQDPGFDCLTVYHTHEQNNSNSIIPSQQY
jgi:hypothetical protein